MCVAVCVLDYKCDLEALVSVLTFLEISSARPSQDLDTKRHCSKQLSRESIIVIRVRLLLSVYSSPSTTWLENVASWPRGLGSNVPGSSAGWAW